MHWMKFVRSFQRINLVNVPIEHLLPTITVLKYLLSGIKLSRANILKTKLKPQGSSGCNSTLWEVDQGILKKEIVLLTAGTTWDQAELVR